jgi:hypothetical protein
LIGEQPEAAVDATGLESRHTSRYFFKRSGRKHSARVWTKLTVVCDTASHFLTAATVSLGPDNDSPQFRPAMGQAALGINWDRVLADGAFDSEEHHRYCREDLGVRSTVIPLNRRNRGAEVAADALPAADGETLPQEAAGEPVPAGLRAALAGGERVLAAQAAAGLGAAGPIGCLPRAGMLPPRADA